MWKGTTWVRQKFTCLSQGTFIFHFIRGTRTLVLLAKNVLYVKLLQTSSDLSRGFNFLATVSAFYICYKFLSHNDVLPHLGMAQFLASSSPLVKL